MALDEALLARNLQLMQEKFPGVHHQMISVKSASRIIGGENGEPFNLDLGHTRFYEGGVDSFIEEQWARYTKRPDRLTLILPAEPTEVTSIPTIVQRGIFRHFKHENIDNVHRLPQERAGYMIVFGVGLGLHLNRIIESFEFRNLIIAEQFAEFIYHSLYFVDWTAIYDKIEQNGGKIFFFLGEKPEDIGQKIYWTLRGNDFGLIDGSYIYRHYSSFMMDGTFDYFTKQIPLLMISKGFFEDEIIMMRNTFQNLAKYDFSLLEPKRRLAKDAPALIVGSGPSVDRSFDLIRSLRDTTVIFSCGTTLRILLRNGIVPHYHCEMENVPAVFEHLEPLSREYDLSGITLVASTTVDPRVPGLFGKRLLYFRDALSSTVLFGDLGRALYGGAPNVSNLGNRVAIMLGFQQIYLIGVDLGSRRADVHHAKDAVYNKEWANTHAKRIQPMNIVLPGNFGGRAYTNTILLWARSMLQSMISNFRELEFYNCSDGVRIVGTTPCLPALLAERSKSFPANDATLKQILREVQECDPRALLKRDRLVEASESFQLWQDRLAEVTASSRAENWDFLKLYDHVAALIDRNGEHRDAELISTVTIGSMMMILQFAYFFAHRLDPELREGFMNELVDRLDEAVAKMTGTVRELYDDFIRQLDEAAAAETTSAA